MKAAKPRRKRLKRYKYIKAVLSMSARPTTPKTSVPEPVKVAPKLRVKKTAAEVAKLGAALAPVKVAQP